MKFAFACVGAIVFGVGNASSAEPALPTGEFVAGKGYGTLVIEKQADGGRRFSIAVIGANAHTCDLDGRIEGRRGVVNSEPGEEACVVAFRLVGSSAVAVSSTGEACSSFCGARASFEQTYVAPPKGCRPSEVDSARERFKKAYQAHDFQTALKLLSPILSTCQSTLRDWDENWLRNDLAITNFKLGRTLDCLEDLKPLTRDANSSDEEIAQRLELPPFEADTYREIMSATRTNLKLCRRGKK